MRISLSEFTEPPISVEILTVKEAAAWLKVSTKSIRQWAEDGTLPGFRIGRTYRFKRAEIEKKLDQFRTGAARPSETAWLARDKKSMRLAKLMRRRARRDESG